MLTGRRKTSHAWRAKREEWQRRSTDAPSSSATQNFGEYKTEMFWNRKLSY